MTLGCLLGHLTSSSHSQALLPVCNLTPIQRFLNSSPQLAQNLAPPLPPSTSAGSPLHWQLLWSPLLPPGWYLVHLAVSLSFSLPAETLSRPRMPYDANLPSLPTSPSRPLAPAAAHSSDDCHSCWCPETIPPSSQQTCLALWLCHVIWKFGLWLLCL